MRGDAGTGGSGEAGGGAALADWVDAATDLDGDDARREFFAAHPELRTASFVEALTVRAPRLLETPGRAEGVVATACWLAEDLGDPRSRGLSLRAAANLEQIQHRQMRALALYEQALEFFAAAGDELAAAITRSAGVGCLSYLGEYQRAQRWARAAREVFEARDDRLRLARLDFNVGHIYVRQDRFREALAHFAAAAEEFRRSGQPRDVGVALRNLAVCHQDLGELDVAVEAYKTARDYCDAHGLTVAALELEYNIAYVYYLRGEYTRAIRAYELVRRRCREQGDPYHEGLCDMDQAEIFLELNLVEEAAELAASAYSRLIELGIVYDAGKSLAYQALATARSRQPRRALEILEQARQLFTRQENLLWLSMIDFYGARVLAAEGRLKQAVELAEDAFEGFVEADVDSRTTACELLLARLALEHGDADRALGYCKAALGRVEAIGFPALEFQALLLAGRAEEESGDVEAALALYRRSEETLERLRGELGTDDLKIAFTRDKRELYEALLLLTLRSASGPEARDAAFEIVERAKSRALIDLLAFRVPELEPRSPAEQSLVEEMRALRRELHWHNHKIDQEQLKGSERSLPRVAELRREAQRRERRLQSLLRRLRTADPELASLQHMASSGLDEVREVLPAGGALLEYFIARGQIFAFVLDRERLVCEPLGAAEEVLKLDRYLRLQLGKAALRAAHRERFGAGEAPIRKLLSGLYERLVAPVRPLLAASHLVIVPHGFLHQLPFAAFQDGDRYLLDDFSISLAPSATVLRLCCRRRGRLRGGALVLGVPDEKAPLIEREVRAVARVLPDSRLLIGAEATREELLAHGPGRAVVHLATHGFHRSDNPMFSSIQLGGGRLSLFDLYQLRLDAGLVVLSGCATGLSSVEGADELVGLTRGLLHAGAHSLIATLWDINDESTAELMSSLYRGLSRGSSPAAELRRAQLELREAYPEPYHWAPFILVGRPDGVALELAAG